jgi:hypothetical protein
MYHGIQKFGVLPSVQSRTRVHDRQMVWNSPAQWKCVWMAFLQDRVRLRVVELMALDYKHWAVPLDLMPSVSACSYEKEQFASVSCSRKRSLFCLY